MCGAGFAEVWLWAYSRAYGWEALCKACNRLVWAAVARGMLGLSPVGSSVPVEAIERAAKSIVEEAEHQG